MKKRRELPCAQMRGKEQNSFAPGSSGFENFEAAAARGKGVLFLTAHLGAWELSSFFHSLAGHPMHVVARGLDNPYVDGLVTRYRALHGNQIFDKDDYARALLSALRNGEIGRASCRERE